MKKVAVALKGRPKKFPGIWISVSKAKTLDGCAAKFKFNYILKLPRKTWEFHTLGTFAHKVFELFWQARLEGDERPDHVLMTAVFNMAAKDDEFKDKKTKKCLITKEQKRLVYDMAMKFLEIEAKQREEGTAPRIIGVENNFYINIFDKVLLNGMIDVEQIDPDNMLHLADYKTSKSMRYLKNDFFQLMVYAYVKCVEDPTIERVRCSYIMLRHGFKHITKEFDRDEIMTMQDKMLEYAERMNSEKLYRANPTRLCDYCDFLDSCSDGQEFLGKGSAVKKFGAQGWG